MSGDQLEKNGQVLPVVRQHEPNRKMVIAWCLGKSNSKNRQNFVKESILVKVSQ